MEWYGLLGEVVESIEDQVVTNQEVYGLMEAMAIGTVDIVIYAMVFGFLGMITDVVVRD